MFNVERVKNCFVNALTMILFTCSFVYVNAWRTFVLITLVFVFHPEDTTMSRARMNINNEPIEIEITTAIAMLQNVQMSESFWNISVETTELERNIGKGTKFETKFQLPSNKIWFARGASWIKKYIASLLIQAAIPEW